MSSTVQTESTGTALLDHAKGGELVLKLFAFTQTFATSTVEALRRREEGQTMAEYGVVLAVITVALVTAFGLLSNKIGVAINNVANVIK